MVNLKTILFGKTERRLGVSAALWFVLYLAARALLEQEDLSRALRVGMAILPVPAFIWFIREYVAAIRTMDELERRIQLEALGLAFPLTLVLIMTLGLVQLAMPLNLDDWSYRHIWPFLYVFYFIGLSMARKRYA